MARATPSDTMSEVPVDPPSRTRPTAPRDHSAAFPVISPRRWWGEYTIHEGQYARWRIGPLTLWVQRRPHEWWIGTERAADGEAGSIDIEIPAVLRPPQDALEQQRIAMTDPGTALRLDPALADRSVVVHPEVPLKIHAGDEATIYVSTPLWIQIRTPANRLLAELASHRPSDTWLGPSPTSGELCYSGKSAARLVLEEIPLHPIRAIHTLRVENHSSEMILAERLTLPVPFLSLYVDERGHLFTQPVTIEREGSGATAQVKLGEGPPPIAAEAKLLIGPRHGSSRNVLVRAFAALFG